MAFFSAYAFIGKGIESGMENWRFYTSLGGFLICCIFLFLFFKHVIKDKKENQNSN